MIRKEKLKSKHFKINKDVSDCPLIFSDALEEWKIHREVKNLRQKTEVSKATLNLHISWSLEINSNLSSSQEIWMMIPSCFVHKKTQVTVNEKPKVKKRILITVEEQKNSQIFFSLIHPSLNCHKTTLKE